MASIWIGIAGTALALATPEHVRQSQSSAWAVNVAPGECTLERSLAEPMPATLSLQTRVGSDIYRVALVGPGLPGGGRRSIAILFGQQDKRFERSAELVSLSGGLGHGIVLRYLEPEVIEAFAQSSSITLQVGKKPYGPFALPQAKGAVAAFRKCIGDQLVEWGADPAQFAPGGATPTALASRDDWLTHGQLIGMASNSGPHDLDATFVVGIAEDGSIASCGRTEGSRGDQVEKIACGAVLKKKLFAPARDAQGKPVRGAATFEAKVVRR
jgi:hypothetical protein